MRRKVYSGGGGLIAVLGEGPRERGCPLPFWEMFEYLRVV